RPGARLPRALRLQLLVAARPPSLLAVREDRRRFPSSRYRQNSHGQRQVPPVVRAPGRNPGPRPGTLARASARRPPIQAVADCPFSLGSCARCVAIPPRYSRCPHRGFADRVFCQCLARLEKIALLAALVASGCPSTTMSSPASSSACWRNDSRTSRFKRFLSQAFRQCFLDIASPSLAWSIPFSLDKTVNSLSRLLLALANTRLNASAPGKRLALLKRWSRTATDPEPVFERPAIAPSSSRPVLSDAFVIVGYCGVML